MKRCYIIRISVSFGSGHLYAIFHKALIVLLVGSDNNESCWFWSNGWSRHVRFYDEELAYLFGFESYYFGL